jgi:hypothetical protein
MLRQSAALSTELAEPPQGSDPIVIADHHMFVELSHDSAPQLRERFLYLVNADLDLRYLHSDNGALLMEALRHRTSLHILDYDTGMAAHRHFYVAAMQYDYLPTHLAATGWSVKLLHSSGGAALYEITWAPDAKSFVQ